MGKEWQEGRVPTTASYLKEVNKLEAGREPFAAGDPLDSHKGLTRPDKHLTALNRCTSTIRSGTITLSRDSPCRLLQGPLQVIVANAVGPKLTSNSI